MVNTPGVFLQPLHGGVGHKPATQCLEELISASIKSQVKINDKGGELANNFKIVGVVTNPYKGKTQKWEGE